MAGPERFRDADLTRFPIFAAIRYLSLAAADDRLPLGHFHAPAREAVRLAGSARLAHCANEIEAAEFPAEAAPLLRTCGYGLLGASGELPHAWSAYVLEREQRGDRAPAAFLDIFHHRLLSFLYRAWCASRFPALAEAGQPNPLDRALAALLGLSPAQPAAALTPALLACAALLLPRPRSAEALRGLLACYFDVPVAIEQFRGGWRPFSASQYTLLADEPAAPNPHQQLGRGAALGEEAWDPHAAIRIRLGPMRRSRYEEFLPGGPAFAALHLFAGFFSRGSFDYEINPILAREDVPRIHFAEAEAPESAQYQAAEVRLGWTTWLASRPLDRDGAETVLPAWLPSAAESARESARTGNQTRPGRT